MIKAPKMKVSVTMFFVLLIMCLSPGLTKASSAGTNPPNILHYKAGGTNSRKLMRYALDYDYAGPNPKHDPRGKRGGGGKNP